MQLLNIAVSFFQEGGIFMYPIVLVLAIGLTIAIERYLHQSRRMAGAMQTVHSSLPRHGHSASSIFGRVARMRFFTFSAFRCIVDTIISQVTGSSSSFQQS